MPPMQPVDGTPPTRRWVPQPEPLDLDEPLGYVEPDDIAGGAGIYLEDLDPAVQHRIESWPEAVALLQLTELELRGTATGSQYQIRDWLAANAPEES